MTRALAAALLLAALGAAPALADAEAERCAEAAAAFKALTGKDAGASARRRCG